MKTGTIYKVDGRRIDCAPLNGEYYSLAELQAAVGGETFLLLRFGNGEVMVTRRDGLLTDAGKNECATRYAALRLRRPMYVVGDVLVCGDDMVK